MGYNVKWLIENEIVYVKFWGNGDANELRLALTDITTLRRSSPRDSVHIITNVQDVTIPVRFQDSMKVMKEFERGSGDSWEIVVGKIDRLLRLSLSISRSIVQTKSINFHTLDEALNHLKKEDKLLSWEKLNQTVLDSRSES